MDKITMFGENGLIHTLTDNFTIENKSTVSGVGNDASVIDNGDSYTLASTDLLLEGVHFNLTYFPLKHLGYKSVIRAISDIYAMNGKPAQILLGIGISKRFPQEAVVELYNGVALACKKYNIDLVGGDTTASLTGLTISITAIGSVKKEELITRGGAKVNDLICVTGDLGAAYIGLQILERERALFEEDKGIQPDLSGADYVIGRQVKPEVPIEMLDAIKKAGIQPTSMIDITNGLASDMMQICSSSGTGCKLYPERIPVDYETSKFAEEFSLEPLIPALNGGDDFEMLFTVPLAMHDKIKAIKGISIIGHVSDKEDGMYLVGDDGTSVQLTSPGWE